MKTLFIVIVIAFIIDSISSAQFYISPEGNDENDCKTIQSPCKTLFRVIQIASANDDIHLLEGSYPEDGNVNILIDKSLSFHGTENSKLSCQHQSVFVINNTITLYINGIQFENCILVTGEYVNKVIIENVITRADSTIKCTSMKNNLTLLDCVNCSFERFEVRNSLFEGCGIFAHNPKDLTINNTLFQHYKQAINIQSHTINLLSISDSHFFNCTQMDEDKGIRVKYFNLV